MNGIFMGGLKISRAAGRGARRPLVLRNFLSFATFIFIYRTASATARTTATRIRELPPPLPASRRSTENGFRGCFPFNNSS